MLAIVAGNPVSVRNQGQTVAIHQLGRRQDEVKSIIAAATNQAIRNDVAWALSVLDGVRSAGPICCSKRINGLGITRRHECLISSLCVGVEVHVTSKDHSNSGA